MTSNEIGTAIAIVSASVAVISAIITFFQRKRSWYVGAIATPRLAWADNVRNALADLITDYYNGRKNISAKVDCTLLYLNPENKYQKKLFSLLEELKEESSDVKLRAVISEAQWVLRINWWAVKIDATLSYRMDKRRDRLIAKRMKQHGITEKSKAQIKEAELPCEKVEPPVAGVASTAQQQAQQQ